MLNSIDNFLNKVTMYRLVLYYLIFLFLAAVLFGLIGFLPYNPVALIISATILTAISWATNFIFASVFETPTNAESVFITALILTLIITPPKFPPLDRSLLPFLVWAAIWAMASKYIFAIGKKHIFNPAAFAVALTALALNRSASWWIGGNLPLFLFVLLGGLLIVRKLKRANLVLSFLIAAGFSIVLTAPIGQNPVISLFKALGHSPLLFFAFVMLTEPLTTPPTRFLQIGYGALVGIIFAPAVHFGSIYSTPELALLCGNIFSYLISPKWKQVLRLKEKIRISPDIYDFVFSGDKKLKFRPGQYLEWTLRSEGSDSRGNRRYFTIASSPTEEEIRVGVKFYAPPSSFKKALFSLKIGDPVIASQLAGDFTLPRDKNQKLTFIAGGIGITPFRSMVKYLLDKNERRPIILFYAAKTERDFVYTSLFEEARKKIGLETVYIASEALKTSKASNFTKNIISGQLNPRMISEKIPDYRERTFYLSGPRSLVVDFQKVLKNEGISKSDIKTDFFPGFA